MEAKSSCPFRSSAESQGSAFDLRSFNTNIVCGPTKVKMGQQGSARLLKIPQNRPKNVPSGAISSRFSIGG
jgi:hypothetical protein